MVPQIFFKKSDIDRYVDRPSALFSCRKYIALDHSCYAGSSADFTIDNQLDHSSGQQPNKF